MDKPSDWVTLVGHVAWPVTVIGLCLLAKNQLRQIVEAIAKRIADRQSHVKIGKAGLEIKTLEQFNPALSAVESIQPTRNGMSPGGGSLAGSAPGGFAEERDAVYRNNRDLFLVHVLEPTIDHQQEYDLFIYILPHKKADLSAVKKAEFFFGKYWGNRVFIGRKVGNVIGVRTSAYGPFLCTCHVTFADGEVATLTRYIDFEMGELVKKATGERSR